jgi:Holliday junction DNA helicase RuvA
MIATLSGKVQARSDDALVVNVGGVGFRVRVSTGTLASLGAVGRQIELFTHLRVREDELTLYGFATSDELALFETLMTVSGIGPKVAMGIVSNAAPDTLRLAISRGDLDVLTALPGLGKKTAQRLVLELKGKIDVAALGEVAELAPVDEEVMNALVNLGYSAAEATRAARSVPATAKTIEDRIRIALQYLGGA